MRRRIWQPCSLQVRYSMTEGSEGNANAPAFLPLYNYLFCAYTPYGVCIIIFDRGNGQVKEKPSPEKS